MKRRKFLQALSVSYALQDLQGSVGAQSEPLQRNSYSPGRITNEYLIFCPAKKKPSRRPQEFSRSSAARSMSRPEEGSAKNCRQAVRSMAGVCCVLPE